MQYRRTGRYLQSYHLLGSLGLLDDGSKSRLLVNSQIRQHLAVNLDTGFLQTTDKATIGQTMLTGTSVDTLNPQGTELTLALTTVTIGILAGLDDSLLGHAKNARTGTVVTLGHLKNFLVTTTSDDTTLDTSHSLLLTLNGNQGFTDSAACAESEPCRHRGSASCRAGDAYAWSTSWSECGYGMTACA